MRQQTSFFISRALKNEMRRAMKKDGYSARQQSKWVEEALLKLREDDPFLETLQSDDELSDRISITTSERFLDAMEAAVTVLRRQDPAIERVRGAVIRTAIRNRLNGS